MTRIETGLTFRMIGNGRRSWISPSSKACWQRGRKVFFSMRRLFRVFERLRSNNQEECMSCVVTSVPPEMAERCVPGSGRILEACFASTGRESWGPGFRSMSRARQIPWSLFYTIGVVSRLILSGRRFVQTLCGVRFWERETCRVMSLPLSQKSSSCVPSGFRRSGSCENCRGQGVGLVPNWGMRTGLPDPNWDWYEQPGVGPRRFLHFRATGREKKRSKSGTN